MRQGKYFGGGIPTYELRVIEYQNRGLPHAHIVMQLSNGPDHQDLERCAQWIDKNIAATIPSEVESIADPEKMKLRKLIKHHMTHTCADAVNGCLKNGVCKRGYGNRTVTTETTFDFRGFPDYKRPATEDLRVVPYHPLILKDWEGHINCEFAGGKL